MTLKEALTWGVKNLQEAKITSANLDAEVILSFVTKKTKEFIFTYPEKKLLKRQISLYKKLIKKRQKFYPVAYITGKKEFCGKKFIVNKDVLIPRPETEILIEAVLKTISATKLSQKKFNIADIGTGSGCIIITLSNHFKKSKFFAVDKSKKALIIAKKNSKKLTKKKITFLNGSLLTPLEKQPLDIIVANLPYLDNYIEKLLKYSESKALKYEPQSALKGGHDGLELYIKMFQQIKAKRKKPKYIFIEIGHLQTRKIKKIIRENFPKAEITIIQDLAKQNRVVKIVL